MICSASKAATLVCLTTQEVGVEGLPPVSQGLAAWDPQRYGTLSIPSDDYSYDILTQGAQAIGKELRALYLDKASFLAKFAAVAQRAVVDGVLLSRDVAGLLAKADETWRD